MGVFQESLETLKIAQNKLTDSGESLKKINKESLGADILVPLSGSMYVPGKIADAENVIIDIGTGYYVQKVNLVVILMRIIMIVMVMNSFFFKDMEGAVDYFKRKVNFITEQMEKIQEMGLEKSKVRDAIVEVMEIKLQAQMQTARQPSAKT